MGYYITQGDTSFTMQKEKFPAAIEALNNAIDNDIKSWVNSIKLDPNDNAHTHMKTLLEECRWEPTFDEEGNIDHIGFTGEKLGDETELFRTLAPFIDADSEITISGEDDTIWRYSFDGTGMEEDYAVLDFDGNKEIVEKILELKDVLPTLIGLHPKLDARIAKVLDE
jgi:hypothetical protein